MKILILGSGGREHALAWRCSLDETVDRIFVSPGNGGTSSTAENILLDLKNFESVKDFCLKEKIDLIIVGSEEFLAAGIVDYLEKYDLKVFGPNQKAAKLESDKSFAKNFMKKYEIPTASHLVFDSSQIESALSFLRQTKYPVVIKVSGLAAGKGVIISPTFDDAEKTIKEIFINRNFGEAGEKIVIEQFLEGEELSLLVVTDGTDYKILPTSQDHKRVFDNDMGKNTGGMGAYSPAPIASETIIKSIEERIILPTLICLKKEDINYKGCLYFGLMIDQNSNPFVIEYNSRFGDPETQAVLPLLEGKFSEFLISSANGKLESNLISIKNDCSICVVSASSGYPDQYEKGKEIFGLETLRGIDNCYVFHSGTKYQDGKYFTNGGRVLCITLLDKDSNLVRCKKNVYEFISKISFDGMHYRKDIADKGIKHIL